MSVSQCVVCCVLVLVLVCGGSAYRVHDQEGCGGGDTPMCCQGKDSECVVKGQRVSNNNSTTCFCDSQCGKLGDCCLDYRDVCQAVDCVLEHHWGPYGECDALCGAGNKYREKRIRIEPRNGGKECPRHKMRRRCVGRKCKVPRSFAGGWREQKETGKIIPAEYGTWRRNKLYNPYKGIRKNLFNHYSPNAVQERQTYCSTYKLVSTRKSCNSTFFADWAPKLQRGADICVECQPLAMKENLGMRCYGHGVFGKKTRWNAVTVPGCHGEWVMSKPHEECSCEPDKMLSFILI